MKKNVEPNLSRDSRIGATLTGIMLVLFVLFPVLYLLSIGPVGAATKSSKNDATLIAVQNIYHPVFWLRDNTNLKRPLDAYARLWGVKLGL